MLLTFSLDWNFPSSTFWRATLVGSYCTVGFLLWNGFLYLSIVIHSFAGCSSLGQQFCSQRGRTYIQVLLAFRLHWKVRGCSNGPAFIRDWSFSLAGFLMLSLFCNFSVLAILCCGEFLFWFCLVVCYVCFRTLIDTTFFRLGKVSPIIW